MTKHIHGGDIYSHANCLDFSANCNPLGTPESVKKAVADSTAHIQNYPQVGYAPLKKALAEYEGVSPEAVVCGNGAAEIIYTLCQTLKPKYALLPAPTFAEYEQALTSCGCNVEYTYLTEKNEFRLEKDFTGRLHKNIDIVFLCNPNNPTGLTTGREYLFGLLRRCREMGAFLVVDECFLDFVPEPGKYTLKAQLERYHNLFILKAFTKRYAMAGLRLGYGLCENRELLESMNRTVQPWNISVPAQAAGLAALKETGYVENGRRIVFEELPYLKQELTKLGLKVWPSEANYLFFKGPENLTEACTSRGVLIRDCSNYTGLGAGFYRIAVRTHTENMKLTEVLRVSLEEIR